MYVPLEQVIPAVLLLQGSEVVLLLLQAAPPLRLAAALPLFLLLPLSPRPQVLLLVVLLKGVVHLLRLQHRTAQPLHSTEHNRTTQSSMAQDEKTQHCTP
mgnify:CR=1 FL=1